MQVKQKLRITSVVSVIALLVIFGMLFLTIYRVNRAFEVSKVADDIVTASFERLMLRTDSLRTGNERTKEQLIAKHKLVGALLKEALEKFPDPKDKKTVSELLTIHESIGKLSKTIRENREKMGRDSRPDALFLQLENRLLSQLNMRVYESVLLDGKLQKSGNDALVLALKHAGVGTAFVLLFIGSTTLINSWSMGRTIADRVRRLRDGATVVGGGNLEHHIDIKGDDEFVEISDAFNAMTAKLSGSYRALESEIDERKQAEEALRESEEKLSLALRSADMGVWRLDLREQRRHFDNQVCRCLGIDPAGFGGTAEEFIAAVHPDDHDGIRAALDRTIGSGEPYEAEYRVVWPDGHIHHVAARGRLTLDAAGQPRWVDGLVWDITERKHAEESLLSSLREKEVMLKEIHHRVKNNLQVISSLAGLQADGTRDETVREVLRDVTYRVRSMALVHEKLYQSADLARIDFSEYVRSLLNYLWRAHGSAAAPVRLIFDLEPLSLPVDTAVPCGLIMNELAGNALKHAFRGMSGGEVTVSLHETPEGRVSLCLSDNGVGLPPELDWRQARSLGLRLVQMLAGQLNATVELDRCGGTEFKIIFNIPETAKDGEPLHE